MPIAWPIWWLTKSSWNHAEVYLGHGLSIGAHFNGIRISTLKELNSWPGAKLGFLRPKDTTAEKGDSVADFSATLEGKGYDFWHIVQYVWRIILGTLGKAPMADDPDRYVCFEFVAYCWEHEGVSVAGKFSDNATGKSFTDNPNLEWIF